MSGGAPWLSVSSTQGSAPTQVTIAVTPTGLVTGTYTSQDHVQRGWHNGQPAHRRYHTQRRHDSDQSSVFADRAAEMNVKCNDSTSRSLIYCAIDPANQCCHVIRSATSDEIAQHMEEIHHESSQCVVGKTVHGCDVIAQAHRQRKYANHLAWLVRDRQRAVQQQPPKPAAPLDTPTLGSNSMTLERG